ncbi:MAG: rod shape-determining protein MreC [Mariprofundaceae bacterium]
MAPRPGRQRAWLATALVLSVLIAAWRLPLGSWLDLALAPALQAMHAPVQWWQGFRLWFEDSRKLQARYLELRKRHEQQAALIQEARSLREENRQLRRLLGVAGITGWRWHAAKVRGRSPDAMSQRLIVETRHASPDDVVVSSEGLVGIVDSANERFATVRTILDASLAVPVTLPDSPIAALLRGQGDALIVDFVPLADAPEPDRVLVTSGAGGLFPPGIAVARITRVAPVKGEMFAHIEAEPVAHWRRDNWLAIASRWSVAAATATGNDDPPTGP